MSSPVSSAPSFVTAVDEVTISSQSPLPGHGSEGSEVPYSYRGILDLPQELCSQCMIYLDEKIYGNALTMLNNLLLAGKSSPTQPLRAYLPPAQYIGLAGTLLVHPFTTTGSSSRDRLDSASYALLYLRNILTTVGPVNGNLDDAFTFAQRIAPQRTGKSKRSLEKAEGSDDADSDKGDLYIKEYMASKEGLWEKADDFWQAVGWSFNCSIRHRKRWEYWRVWLEFMLDVLDVDWKERRRLDEQGKSESANERRLIDDCMILKYLTDLGGRAGGVKRAVKAVFADGSTESIRLFPEIFSHETKNRKSTQDGVMRNGDSRVDIDKGKYGDYADDDYGTENNSDEDTCAGEDTIEVDTSQTLGSEYAAMMGGPEAMALRLRLISLISRACQTFPGRLTSLANLYALLYEYIRPLPFISFTMFISPSASTHLTVMGLSTLVQIHLRRLLQSAAPHSSLDGDEITQDILEDCFLPFAANTASMEDNAKVSLLIETLFRIFVIHCTVKPTPKLRAALEKGILARQARTVQDKRMKASTPKGRARERDAVWLDASGARLTQLLHAVEMRGETTGT